MKKIALIAFLGSFLGGCGTLGNMVMNDNSLATKAAFALNTTSDKVKISNRSSNIDSINFVATTKGKSYQCYITTMGGVVSSDAVCSGANSVMKENGQQCNPLLKAAGRC